MTIWKALIIVFLYFFVWDKTLSNASATKPHTTLVPYRDAQGLGCGCI
jgi:hypothetical protein